MAERALLLRIHGRVQGVGYRWNMVREARRLGAHGWVRNRLDGSVEALAWGDAGAVEALLAWSREGPEGARVLRVEASEAVAEAEFQIGFEQRATL